jgi:hypothetical protein
MNHPRDRLFRGYGPLIGFAAMFLAVAVLVPSKQREVRVEAAGGGRTPGLETTEEAELASEATGEAAVDGAAVDGDAAVGGTDAGTGGAGAAGSGPGGARSGPPRAAGCGPFQVPGDPYSPPCITFNGDNGGATARGVSGDTITVAVRIEGFSNGILDAVSRVAGATIPNESPDVIARTLTGLVEYFNKRYQFYGRKLKLVIYNGKGDVLKETTGGGQEGAQADVFKVVQEI